MEDFWIRRYIYGEPQNGALFIFPHWGGSAGAYRIFARLFRKFRAVVYEYADSILSADIEATAKNFELLEKLVLADVSNLRKEGVDRFLFHGTSLGAVPAVRSANNAAGLGNNVTHVVLNVSGADLPYAIWNGCVTSDIRKSFDVCGITFGELTDNWGHLSPIRNLDTLKHAKILLYVCDQDDVIVRSNVRVLVNEVRSNFPNVVLRHNKILGHKSAAIRNILKFREVHNFFKS